MSAFLRRLRTPSGIVELLLRLVVGGVFLYAGTVKARDPIVFLEDIRSFHLVPDPWAAWLAMGLPWLEIFAGAAVITGVFAPGGLVVISASLVVFLAAIGTSMARGLDITCGCFGKSDGPSVYAELIARNTALLAAAVWLLVRCGRREEKVSGE